jgi:hypothetical protein
MSYVKLSDLQQFTIKEVLGYSFKKWDEINKTMLFSKDWVDGYNKRWGIETDQGQLEVSSSQLGTMLERVCDKGRSNLLGTTFAVKTNGKTGQDIRYFFNFVKPSNTPPPDPQPDTNAPFSNDDLPF